MPQKFMSHPCSFFRITAGYFTLEFPSLYETEDWFQNIPKLSYFLQDG
jgi:hypothetical protein